MQHKTKVSPILERDLEGAETRRCGSPSPMAVPRAAQGPNPPAVLAPGGGGLSPAAQGLPVPTPGPGAAFLCTALVVSPALCELRALLLR